MLKKLSPAILLLILFSACSSTRPISEIRGEGNSAYRLGDYENALKTFEAVIITAESKGKVADVKDYAGAGKSAHALCDGSKAQKYLEEAQELKSTDSDVYAALADVYYNIDNLTKEIGILEYYQEKYPTGNKIKLMQTRLFEAYTKSEDWNMALNLWPIVKDNTKYTQVLLESYLKINQGLENKEECDKTAKQLLRVDNKNMIALEWSAERYFWKAENLYQKEMAAYDKKKTNSQYAKLLKALDIITMDFKRSRDYFEKLYEANPRPHYAKYLGNIYARLDDKAKAKYYRSKTD